MRSTLVYLVALALPLAAAPIVTAVDGSAVLGTFVGMNLTGPDVSIYAGTERGRSPAFLCEVGIPCPIHDSVGAANGGQIPVVSASYKGHVFGTDQQATMELKFFNLQTFGLDARNAEIAVPVDVFGQVTLGAPGTQQFIDLRFRGSGMEDFIVGGLQDSPFIGEVFTMQPVHAAFTGDLSEAPEPASAFLFASVALVLASRRIAAMRA